MKKRLFAAAMAMTMVMASSIPALAYTIEDSTTDTSTKSHELDLNATIHVQDAATTGSTDQRQGDKAKNVWAVDISANNLTYNINKTPTTDLGGYKEYKWNASTHTYDNDSTNASSTFRNVYSFAGTENVDNVTGRASKQFTISNHSNFSLSAAFAAGSNVTGVNASEAFSTSDPISSITTGSANVGYVYLDLDGITDSLTYEDGVPTEIGKLTINLSAGDRVS